MRISSFLFEIFFGKIYIAFFYFEFLAVEVFKNCRLTDKIKPQLVGIKSLIFISAVSVGFVDSVFSVADEGVADMRHMRSYLMRSAGQQLNLN